MTEPTTDAAPQVIVDPTWQVTTHLGIIQVNATEAEWTEDGSLMFFNDAAVTTDGDGKKRNLTGLVAAIPGGALAYAFDERFGKVIEPPKRVEDSAGE